MENNFSGRILRTPTRSALDPNKSGFLPFLLLFPGKQQLRNRSRHTVIELFRGRGEEVLLRKFTNDLVIRDSGSGAGKPLVVAQFGFDCCPYQLLGSISLCVHNAMATHHSFSILQATIILQPQTPLSDNLTTKVPPSY